MVDEHGQHFANTPAVGVPARPMWARIVVITAGVVMNVLLAVAIFRRSIPCAAATDGHHPDRVCPPRERFLGAGPARGDRVVSVNGAGLELGGTPAAGLHREHGAGSSLVVERGGRNVPHAPARRQPNFRWRTLILHRTGVVHPDRAGDAGPATDSWRAIRSSHSSVTIESRQQIFDILRANPGKPVEVRWKRGTRLMSGTVVVNDSGKSASA